MTNGNDPISPRISTQLDESSERLVPVVSSHGGLTKREYFAAMAMQGLLATGTYHTNFEDAPSDARRYADELIEALNKESK